MGRSPNRLAFLLVLPLLAGFLAAQQTNSMNASLDLNGSAGSGAAPFSAVIEQPNPLQITVSGMTDQPFVLISGSTLDVGNTVYPAGQIDVGPMPTVILDGIQGPYAPYYANTGPSGSKTIQLNVPSGSVSLGTTIAGLQAAVLDPTNAPFGVRLTAASDFSFIANAGGNAAPLADAGVSTFVNGGTCVTLDGSGSLDPEAQGLTYSWTQVAGATVTLSSATDVMPTFTAPTSPQSLVFELVVNDGAQNSLPANVYIAVQAPVSTVSFANDVYPLFQGTCTGCHGTIANLTLSGTPSAVHAELLEAAIAPGLRADPCDPASSLILTKPSSFGPYASSHGTNIFNSSTAANYLTVLNWIAEGAQNN